MQDTLHFPMSKKKAIFLLLGSLIFVALGAWIRAEQPLVGWSCMIFFGLGIPVSLFIAFSKKMYLLLDAQGFEMGSPFKTVRTAWTEVAGFEIASLSGTKIIAIHYNESYQAQRALRVAVRAVSGVEGAIANSYTVPLPTLLQHLREWHARFGKTAG